MGRINMTLMDQTMAAIEENEERWRQGVWGQARFDQAVLEAIGEKAAKLLIAEDPLNPACGSAFCFAGNVAFAIDRVKPWIDPLARIDSDGDLDLSFVDIDGKATPVSHYARDRLGLLEHEASRLFAPENDLDTLQEMVEYMREHDELGYDWREIANRGPAHVCDCSYCDSQQPGGGGSEA